MAAGRSAVGRRDDPDVDVEGAREPDGTDLARAQEPQEHRLGLERELADLVEKDGAAVGLSQEPGAAARRPR